jgi:hypothetical protein
VSRAAPQRGEWESMQVKVVDRCKSVKKRLFGVVDEKLDKTGKYLFFKGALLSVCSWIMCNIWQIAAILIYS